MLVKIIKGTYGYRKGSIILPKTCKDEPFELENDKADVLISKGVAERVEAEKKIDVKINSEKSVEMQENEDELENMSYNDLKKLAKKVGATAVGSKEELIEKIKSCTSTTEMDEDEEEPPILTAANPE